LAVVHNELESSEIKKMFQDNSLHVEISQTGKKAIELLRKHHFDCIIVDYDIQDMSGDELVREIDKARKLFTPAIVYSARALTELERENLRINTSFFVVKQADWIDHLFDATVSHVYIDHKSLLSESRKIIENIHSSEDILAGRTVLVVDDDVRNLFTLTTVLERYKIDVVTAESGLEALAILNKNPKVEMVLMDIMMPEMDGYETTRKIRSDLNNTTLPIIAVTAKAMKGDRQKCIEAGASDYIVKPVKIDQLLSLVRLWFQ
jgi:CheY-like chemotaxis protein